MMPSLAKPACKDLRSPLTRPRRQQPGPFLLGILLFCSANLAAADWKPVTTEDLAIKEPQVEKDADAEVLFENVSVMDEFQNGQVPHLIITEYVRMKIFTPKGRDRFSTIYIPYANKENVFDLAGRTIQPDGSITELNKEDIHERTENQANGFKAQSKSFSLANVQVGSVIEYRWKESYEGRTSRWFTFNVQREIPKRVVNYRIKPYEAPNFHWIMSLYRNNCSYSSFVREASGYYDTTVTRIPSFKEEPYMSPRDNERAWLFIDYKPQDAAAGDKFWTQTGKNAYVSQKSQLHASKTVKRKAEELIADGRTPSEKLRRLAEFCRLNIKSTAFETLTAEEHEDFKSNKNPENTLSQGIGTSRDINRLFAALAIASGFDARIALMPNRHKMFFDKSFESLYFLPDQAVAVYLDGKWQFYDPGEAFVPTGMLASQHEGVPALICDPVQPSFVFTPISEPEQSVSKSEGTFHLGEDGSLEGDVSMEFTGHDGAVKRQVHARQSTQKQEEYVKKLITQRMSTAEISDIHLTNVTDPEKPLLYSFHIRIDGYGQPTGKRLFFSPAFFRQGISPRFPVKERKWDIYFFYPWTEDDKVEIEFPKGYELDNPGLPASMTFQVGHYEVKASVSGGTKLIYTRRFVFGAHGDVLFPAKSYPALKSIFDAVEQSDNHMLALREKPVKAASAQ